MSTTNIRLFRINKYINIIELKLIRIIIKELFMYENEFYKRLYQLRNQRGVSARDMSLSLGQNAGYINSIENGNSMPSMKMFFYICEYLNVTPCEFFDISVEKPEKITGIILNLRKLNSAQIENIDFLIKELVKR